MDLRNKFVGVVGRKGSGKSVMARRLLQRQSRIFVCDQMGEHSWVPEHNVFTKPERVQDFLIWAEEQRHFCGSYIPQRELKDEFEELCEIVYDFGNMLFGIEEVASLCGPNFLPPALSRIVRLGRHQRLSVLYTTQRAGECSRALTAATDVFVIFHTSEPRDLGAIAERTSNQTAEKVSELPLHQCVIFDVILRKEIGLEHLYTQMDGLSKVTPTYA